MKGVIFNLLEQVVTAEYGADTWDALLDAARVEGAYTSLGSYPDEDVYALVGAAAAHLGLPPEAVLRWFGRHAIALLAERYRGFFEGHASTQTFILTPNSIIHPEVRKLYPGADVPEFSFDTSSPDITIVQYQSKRGLCALAIGMIEGPADFFGECATVIEVGCPHRGNPLCTFEVALAAREQAA